MFIRLQNRDIPILKASVRWKLDTIADVKVTVPLQAVPDIRTVRLEDFELYDRGQRIVAGFVNDRPSINVESNQVLTADLGCFDDLGRLTCYRASADAHYQDTAVTDILDDLLLMTGGTWALGDTSTMVDEAITTTIDLRKKEELFAQVMATIKAVPDLHVRYGGLVGGVRQLDIGNFNQWTEDFIQGNNLTSLRMKLSQQPAYRVIEAYGNRSALRRVTLLDALSDARTTTHPDYARFPITEDVATGTWVVTDQNASAGCEVTKFFDLQKTRNDEPPTAAEVAETGYALWLKVVRFMKSNAEYESYSGEVLLPAPPQVGDRAYVHSHVSEPVVDGLSGEVTYIPLFEVNETFRITDVSLDFGNPQLQVDRLTQGQRPMATYGVEVSSNDESEELDPDLELYERLEQGDSFDQNDQTLGFTIPAPVQVTHDSGDAADCDYDLVTPGTQPGKTFTLTSPTPPAWANFVTVNYAIEPADTAYREDAYPATPGDDLVLCVEWPPASPVTVTAQYVFTK